MGTADEIILMYAVNRAYVLAFTARSAFVIIYSGKIIGYLDCALGTSLFALATSYASVLTELADLCALVMVVTLNHNASGVLHYVNDSVGAGLCTKTASDTLLGIDGCNSAVGNAYSVTGADLSAVTVAKTSKGAESIACKYHICRLAGLRTGINILSLAWQTSAVAGNVSNLLYNVSCLNAEDLGDLFCSSVTAGGTKISLVGFTRAERLCIRVTARKSAGSAVCTGKAFSDRRRLGVLLYRKEDRCGGKKSRAKNSDSEKE